MKILIIGGTGTISSAITRQLSESGHELWLLNRGNRKSEVPSNVRQVVCDINDEAGVLRQVGSERFDAVCEFIGFVPSDVERDIRLFRGRTRQYVYISSASAYAKP
ncbi:MAG: NAD-dependent epimerase/dehydratase family protein, partial [Bacteroidaceae bacterium]|nr:NAD-dependent epimerase/dehydratase family protein [Bacteroidaceae bacterium]